MHDPSISGKEPRNWSQAFSVLPLEAPGDSAWPAISASVAASQTKRHRPLRWLAAAAVLALAIAVPIAWMQTDTAVGVPVVARIKQQADALPGSSSRVPDNTTDAVATTASASAEDAHASVPASTIDASAQPAAHGDQVKRVVAAAAIPSRPTSPAAIAQEPATDVLTALYAQSAQLEAVLAQVQDDRVASGPAAAVAAEYQSNLALIDAALSDPALADVQRPALWRERVDALQQLVDFESTQRWLTARGERYDGQLVAVY